MVSDTAKAKEALQILSDLGYNETVKVLELEIEKRLKDDSSSSSSSASSDSSDDSDDESKDDNATERPIESAKEPIRKESNVVTSKSSGSSSSESDSSTSDESDSSSSSSSSDSSASHLKRKKQNIPTASKHPSKKLKVDATPGASSIVSPDDGSDAVSDVDVSDVSSDEVSSSSDSSSSDSSDSSSSSSSESESFDEESDDEESGRHRIEAKRKAAAKKAEDAAKAALAWTPKKNSLNAQVVSTTPGSDGAQAMSSGKPFKRVDGNFWGNKASKQGGAMADNSYEAVFGADGYGARSSGKLLQVRGKDFTREKNKRKRSFNGLSRNGGKINVHESNSTKFVYNSD